MEYVQLVAKILMNKIKINISKILVVNQDVVMVLDLSMKNVMMLINYLLMVVAKNVWLRIIIIAQNSCINNQFVSFPSFLHYYYIRLILNIQIYKNS